MITRWDLNELNHSEDELYHHGVMGMRWGHRKQEVSSSNPRARKFAPDTIKETRRHSGISGFVNKMSARSEIRAHNTRKAYNQMSKKRVLANGAILGAAGAAGGAIAAAANGGSTRDIASAAGIGGAASFIGGLAGTSINKAIYGNKKIFNAYQNRTDRILQYHGYKRIPQGRI